MGQAGAFGRGWRRRWLCSVCVVPKGLVLVGGEEYSTGPWLAAGFPASRANYNSSPQEKPRNSTPGVLAARYLLEDTSLMAMDRGE
jgi:hypothetical protein